MEPPTFALFVRSASPGAVLRFLERRDDPNKPAEVLISEAVGEPQWRVLFGPPAYLSPLAGPLSIAFPPEVIYAHRDKSLLYLTIYREGEAGDVKTSLDTLGKRHWAWNLGFNAAATPPPIYAWAKEKGIPTRYMKDPPKKIIDYDTIAVLDQRKLLVEDNPRLYRFPLG